MRSVTIVKQLYDVMCDVTRTDADRMQPVKQYTLLTDETRCHGDVPSHRSRQSVVWCGILAIITLRQKTDAVHRSSYLQYPVGVGALLRRLLHRARMRVYRMLQDGVMYNNKHVATHAMNVGRGLQVGSVRRSVGLAVMAPDISVCWLPGR